MVRQRGGAGPGGTDDVRRLASGRTRVTVPDDRPVPVVDEKATFRRAVAVAMVIALLAGWVFVLGPFGLALNDPLSQALFAPLASIASLCCARTARRARGRIRTSWTLLSVGTGLWALGEVSWWVIDGLYGAVPTPSIADVLYLGALIPSSIALVVIPAPARVGNERLRTTLGVLAVGGAVLFTSSALMLQLQAPEEVRPLVTRLVDVAYPIGDVVLASFALSALIRVGAGARRYLLLLVLGFLANSWADSALLYLGALGTYRPGSLPELGYTLGYLLIILAALSPHAADDRSWSDPRLAARHGGWLSFMVYLPLIVAVVAAALLPEPVSDPVSIVTGIVTLILFGVRQSLLSVDNTKLQIDLERQIETLEHRTTEFRRLALQNENIMGGVVDGVVVLDAVGRISFANPAALRLLGWNAQGLLGCDEDVLFAPEDRQVDETLGSTRLHELARVTSASATFARADQTPITVELAVGPISEGSQRRGAVVVFRDITQRRAVEAMKNEFIAVVSHELRTPLTSIRAGLGMLAGGVGGPLSDQGSRLVDIALESSARLGRLIEDMLDIERIESGDLTMVYRDCPVAGLVSSALDDVAVMAAQKGVAVVTERVEGVVRADADRIVQTLTNLIGNAVKFSPPTSTVRVSAVVERSMVRFSVKDEGRGIPADMAEQVFQRFVQVEATDGRDRAGAGLGLAISRNIVQRHGGRIWVAVADGPGATLCFTVPVASAPESGGSTRAAGLLLPGPE